MGGVIKTDQVQCFDADGRLMDCSGSGQDGEMRFGIKWPIPRFEEQLGVTVDLLSGLMWPRDAALTEFPQTWHEALGFIEKMNNELNPIRQLLLTSSKRAGRNNHIRRAHSRDRSEPGCRIPDCF